MRGSALLTLTLILLILPFALQAQSASGVNLSGTWKLNAAKSKLLRTSKTPSQTLVIKQDGQIVFFYDTDGKQSVENYTADKKERVIREIPEAGSKIVAKAYWKGATFITETKAIFNGSSAVGEIMNTKDSWTISGDGFVLTEKTQWDEGQSVSIYDKQ
jgi:hypothetical protein